MNKTQEKNLRQRREQRIKIIRNTAITLLILIVGFTGNHFYKQVNYRTTTATVTSSIREVVGLRMNVKVNENIWGTHLVVEFESEGKIIESHALLQSFPQYRTGDKVKVRFNKRKPDKCYLIE